MKTASRLERILSAGHFAVTTECGPPRGAEPAVIRRKGEMLKGFVDAINVTDNQTSVVRMSSIASCVILQGLGFDPIVQMVTRDRNRIALQSDILGAAALGMNNLLCLSGDHQTFGDDPEAKNVFDLDSIQLIQLVKRMRDEGTFPSGKKIEGPPRFFIGAAENPFAEPFDIRPLRLAKKVEAGVDFIQTQCIYNLERFEKFMDEVRKLGLHKEIKILAGVTPLKSAGMAKFMKKNVAGMDVPDSVVKRMADTPKEEQPAAGIQLCVESIQRLRQIEGIAGVHVMAIEWEQKVPEIVGKAGLLPRPEPSA
ncbi:MAG: methylenetetrahydrofolate reductase [bacterium]